MILTDSETNIDLLNNEPIAKTIIELLRRHSDRPITVGIHGDWGAGKSSVLEMIEASIGNQSDVLCLKFNGWRFQGFEDAKIALIEGIVTGLIEKRPMLTRAGAAVKAVFRRIDWLKAAKKAGGLAFTAFTGVPTVDQIQSAVSLLDGLLDDPAKLATKDNAEAAVNGVKDLLKADGTGESKNIPEEINAFRKDFDGLLEKAGVRQLIVLIDDLDRCLPDTAIATLEAVRLFVFTSRTAFVVAADEAMIEYAVRKHFPDLPDSTGAQTYARNYLEKLIQIPFRIPALGEMETRIYVMLLLIGVELGDNDPAFKTLIGIAREQLKRPWISGGLDADNIRQGLGDQASKAHNALALSDQIGPILASGTKGNPRQIKRFLNSLVLRQRTADARGFGGDVKLPILAKLMLAERFLPRVFDQIAASAAVAADGICADLAALETGAAAKSDMPSKGKSSKAAKGKDGDAFKASPTKEAAPSSESAIFGEWSASPAILAWADVRPLLGDVDLRPYLFVAKDRKDYFGATSALGHLSTVVEQLFGGKLAVQALESDLKRLAAPEAAQVFEAVRARIIGGDAFETAPPGIDGLAVLVKAQPMLQKNLVDFLEALPRDQLGAWVCSGWEGVLKESEQRQRFDRLLSTWGAESNPMLKSVASNVLRVGREPSVRRTR